MLYILYFSRFFAVTVRAILKRQRTGTANLKHTTNSHYMYFISHQVQHNTAITTKTQKTQTKTDKKSSIIKAQTSR